jgi:hypothetical protein
LEIPANPHELIVDETVSNQGNRTPRHKGIKLIDRMKSKFKFVEVKIMSIPKIAISNEDDSNLRIFESHLRRNITPILSSPRKSIIKTRSYQPQSPSSSSTTQSFHTCIESTCKDSDKISLPLKRSNTISVVKTSSEQRQLRRINSYQISSKKSFHISERKLNINHRSTIENFTPPNEPSSIYGTPKHEGNSIRLSLDIQEDLNKDQNQLEIGVKFQHVGDCIGFFSLDFSSMFDTSVWRTNL